MTVLATVLDIESSLHNHEVGNFKANPHCPRNWAVWVGASVIKQDKTMGKVFMDKTAAVSTFSIDLPEPGSILVGHNIGFDLLYCLNPTNRTHEHWYKWLLDPRNLIWDTMIAEFRLRGQHVIQPSLDWCCAQRGWPVKPDRMKEYWSNGVSTEDIPDKEVEEYLIHDVTSTANLFLDQLEQASKAGLMGMLHHEMGARVMTMLMEHTGMTFDKRKALDYVDDVIGPQLEEAREGVQEILLELNVPQVAVNPQSPVQLKTVLFGGILKYKEAVAMTDAMGNKVVYKSGARKGKQRYRHEEVEVVYKNLFPHYTGPQDVSRDTLKELMKQAVSPLPAVSSLTGAGSSSVVSSLVVFKLLQRVLHMRELQKQVATYYEGYANLTWSHDSRLHGNLNHCVAATARLSSSAPNLQNAAHTSVRKYFKSRIDGGRLMEFDLKQIEIVVQAILCEDKHMIKDIHDGIDFHSKRAAKAHHERYEDVVQWVKDGDAAWIKKRKDAKIFSFQRAYGAGKHKIAETTGMRVAEVERLIEVEEQEYPGVVAAQKEWHERVDKSAFPSGGKILGMYRSPTGSIYVFEREQYKQTFGFRPTSIKNYMIQGFAGDVIKIGLNRLRPVLQEYYRKAEPEYRPFPIMTVHDSILWDIGKLNGQFLNGFVDDVIIAMTTAVEGILKNTFNIDFQGLIQADVDVGYDWYKMKPFDPNNP